MAPAVHQGTAAALTEQRAITLDAAFVAHPIRFKGVASNSDPLLTMCVSMLTLPRAPCSPVSALSRRGLTVRLGCDGVRDHQSNV
jgi:hypothetical protein